MKTNLSESQLKAAIYNVSDRILSKLLAFKKEHREFTFSVRERDSVQSDEERLAQGQWFQGSNYIYVPLFSKGDTARKVKTLGFVLTFEDDGELSENYLEISFKEGTNDIAEIRFHEELAQRLSITLNQKRVGTWHYDEAEDYLKNLDDYLTRVYPTALELLIKYDLTEKYIIDEKTFSRRIARINEIKLSLRNQVDTTLPTNLALNQILYGPPGTGKTYRLNEIKVNNFTDTATKKTNEQLLHEALVEYPFWQVLAAVLHINLHPLSVTELVEHPVVRYRIKPGVKTKPQNLAWADLQSYADDESTQLSSKYRRSIKLFHKDASGKWSIADDKKKSLTEIIDPELINLTLSRNVKATHVSEVGRYNFITFHQKYSYEDFVEGLKPVLHKRSDDGLELDSDSPGHLAFELNPGIFYDSCLKALALAGYSSFEECYRDSLSGRKTKFAQAKPFALFIDEINRANVSAVFGELITLIETNKRMGEDEEMWVQLPLSQSYFSVPPNLHIIGTMNTADKSIALIDIALRRRFEFIGMYPKYQAITNPDAAELLKKINAFVFEKKGSADYLIGHAYFMNTRPVEHTLATKVIPLLLEYFMGKWNLVEDVFKGSGWTVKYDTTAFQWTVSKS